MEVPPWLSPEWSLSDHEAMPLASSYSDCSPFFTDACNPSDMNYAWEAPINGSKLGNAVYDLLPLSSGNFRSIPQTGLPSPIPPSKLAYPSSNATSKSDDEFLPADLGDDDDREFTFRTYTNSRNQTDAPSKEASKPAWASISARQGSASTVASSRCQKTSKRRKLSNKTPRRSQRSSFRSARSHDSDIGEPAVEVNSPSSKSKVSHNLTERKYRERLNGYFETLLAALPKTVGRGTADGLSGEIEEKRISKGEVLLSAMEYIRELEKNQAALEEEMQSLRKDVDRLKAVWEDREGRGDIS